MNEWEQTQQDGELIRERYDLIMDRCREIYEETVYGTAFSDYFHSVAAFLGKIEETFRLVEQNGMESWTEERLDRYNRSLYEDILEDHYASSYANPDYAAEQLGTEFGGILCFLYTEIRGLIPAAYEQKRFTVTALCELFVEIYNLFEDEESFARDKTRDQVLEAVYYYFFDYAEIFVEERIREQLLPEEDFAVRIIMESDLSDLSYLYSFGEYIGSNERTTASYLNSLPQERIDAMAATYTEGFRDGFINNRIDLGKKKTVNIRYTVGFERVVRAAILQFRAMGLEPVIYRAAVSSINKKQHLKVGYCSTSPNRQYEYDHRFDNSLYFTREFVDRKLACMRSAYERYRDQAAVFAGPAVMEVFGEKDAALEAKDTALALSEEQEQLTVDYNSRSSEISNQYIPRDEYSFTIIAYPVPEIGERYREIFQETVAINTLDKDLYRRIQQALIDALDQGEYVHIKGKNGNQTDLNVYLHALNDPDHETNFENCLADVNIPVGEVFTSPRLAGTCGMLHVSEASLNDLNYQDLHIVFRDGMIADYWCANFPSEEKNRAFIKENLLYNRETLPLGEFAIGTNTAAYAMARKFDILYKLPILIVEKMGPHFAVGDTCYSMSEDNRVYNPDGKEIMAKENECSILRNEDMAKAYFHCHTDITIPYRELDTIDVVHADGKRVRLIENGRFVLPGTEPLNDPLEEMQ